MNRKPTPQLKPKELELISAYLDGQLPESQMKQVRRRLSEDPAFKRAAQELQATRRVLRSTPQIKRRRSFTLTPEMIGKPDRVWNLGRISGMMSVAATILLAVVFAGDLFLFRGVGSFSSADQMNYAAEVAMDDEIAMEAISAEPSGGGAEPPLAAIPEAAVEEQAEAATQAEPMNLASFTATAEIAGDDAVEDTADADQFLMFTPTAVPTETVAAKGTAEPEQSRAAATEEIVTQEGLGEAESEKTAEMDGEVVEEIQPYVEPESGLPAPTFFEMLGERGLIRLVELALLALAIGSGVVALVLRRRRG